MAKLERLLNLMAVLLDASRPVSAEEIRRRVEGYPEALPSFRRSFERDKDDLRSLGVPLRVERIPGVDPPIDGYRIDHADYYLPDPELDPEELASLHLAAMTVQVDGLGDAEALWKLGGVLGDTPAGPAGAATVAMPNNPALVPLFTAVTERRPVRFGYRDEQRDVDPWRLTFQRGRWYLVGWDRAREDERNFRLDRIEGEVETTGEPGTSQPSPHAPDGRLLPAWEIGDGDAVEVRLRVDASRVAWTRQQFGPDVAEERADDGGSVFTVPVVMWPAFRSLVLELLDHAEILDPPDLRRRFVDDLRALAEVTS